MTDLGNSIAPHGGKLINRCLDDKERAEVCKQAEHWPRVPLSAVNLSDIELVANGAMSPLTGFMCQDDYRSVVQGMRLASGLVWSLPITLAVSSELASDIVQGSDVALMDGERLIATLHVTEKYPYDKELEAAQVFRTTETAHPGVARLYAQGDVLLAGSIQMINAPSGQIFPQYRFSPAQTRRLFAERGWQTIVAFQTRNPIHRAHEYIQKTAMETVDGLFLHPLVGETKSDDVSAQVRMDSYEVILEHYYPRERVQLGVFPAAMRYAGPREAIFHAICRKNYGCTHFIVGRDHAGVGKYYGSYDAQHIFKAFTPQEIGITPLFFEHAFYCRSCDGVVTSKTCPHSADQHVFLSGTQVRELLQRGEAPPSEFTRPEVARVLIDGMRAYRGDT